MMHPCRPARTYSLVTKRKPRSLLPSNGGRFSYSGQTVDQTMRVSTCGPLDAHLVAHPCATQWLRGGWPPETLWRAAGAMFVGYEDYADIRERTDWDLWWRHNRVDSRTLRLICRWEITGYKCFIIARSDSVNGRMVRIKDSFTSWIAANGNSPC